MTKKINLKWRLSKLPTVEELQSLIKDKIITQEEARNILFSSEEINERDKESLESEIKFLRELIEKLSNRSQIISTIEIIKPVYRTYPWYKEYQVWCDNAVSVGSSSIANASSLNNVSYNNGTMFSSIETF